VAALVLAQVPDAYVASTVAADELSLVGMDDDVVDGNAMRVVSLYIATPGVPDLDGAIFGRCDQPLGLAMKRYAGDIGRVAIEGKDGIWIGRLYVV
jgi:hypothetical protein